MYSEVLDAVLEDHGVLLGGGGYERVRVLLHVRAFTRWTWPRGGR